MKPSRSSSKRKQARNFDYQSLETRHLLSGNLPALDLQIELARNFISSQPETQYLIDGESDLRFVEVKYGLASTTTRFQQTIDGLPVHGAIITINQGNQDQFQQVHHALAFNESVFEFPELLDTITVNMNTAERAAMERAGVAETYVPTRGEMGWYVDDNGDVHQVWDMMVFSARQPVGDFLTIVDVSSGEVLVQENRAAFATGSGYVYEPNPWQTQGNGTGLADNDDATSTELDAQRVSVVLEGLDEGTGLLIGEFVDVATLNSADLTDVDANEASRVYEYDRDDDRFEQVVVYHAVDQINRYFHALGFDDDSGVPNGIRDFATLANAHWYAADQSFYSGADDAIHMGDGGVDDAEDADIVVHEYGHAIQHNQNAAWGSGEMGAMGEGFGDFLAASFYRDNGDPDFQTLHAPAVGEWDALSYSTDDPPNLRRVDGNKMYPDDLGFGVHADGEIWSRALWDFSNLAGVDYAMQLILEHHFTLIAGATMTDAANAILLANENVNAGDNLVQVRHPFAVRGILAPTDLVQFDQDHYIAGDGMTIYVSDVNAGATGTATVTSSDGDRETVQLVNLGTGYLVGTIATSAGAVVTGDGQIGLINELTDLTVTYGTARDTATAEVEITRILGTDGADVITVTMGSTVVVNVNGEDFFVDPKLQGALEIDAMSGRDKITITDGAGNDQTTLREYSVKIEGLINFSAINVEEITVNSGGGFDSAMMFGTDGDDVVMSKGNSVSFAGQQFINEVNDYGRVLTFATPGGFDRATFIDTAGSDRFYATPIFANMTTSTSFVNARGFDKFMAHATEGGFDFATFVGSEGDDQLYASSELANLKGVGFEINASKFERTLADGVSGHDMANLIGTAGNDIYFSKPTYGYLYGAGYFNQASRFDVVTAHAGLGMDQANLMDSPGADSFFATPTYATLKNNQYRAQANGFDKVSAIGTAGFNSAVLRDSNGVDRYIARPGDAYLVGDGYLNYTKGFNFVRAISSGGGDIVIFHDSREDDRFFGSLEYSILSGSTFYNRADNFRRVTAYFTKGVDRGRFEDSTGDDTFVAKGDETSLFNDDYFVYAVGLDVVVAVSEDGGKDLLSKTNLDLVLIEQGNWNQ